MELTSVLTIIVSIAAIAAGILFPSVETGDDEDWDIW